MNYRFAKDFKIIHRKIIFNLLEKYIQDQRFFDILNKLFNSKSCSICEFNSFNKYFVNQDLLSLLFINIFFHRLDMEIWNIKSNLIPRRYAFPHRFAVGKEKTGDYGNNHSFISLNNESNVSGILNNIPPGRAQGARPRAIKLFNSPGVRYIRYYDEFLIGIKGSKQTAIDIKKKIDILLESNLHLKLINKENSLVHIPSDRVFIFNVLISSQYRKDINVKKSSRIHNNDNPPGAPPGRARGRTLKLSIRPPFPSFPSLLSFPELCSGKSKMKETVGRGAAPLDKRRYNIIINANIIIIKKILFNTGILNNKLKPQALRKFLNLDSYYIIYFYREVSLLIWNSFSICNNYQDVLKIILYHIK